MIIQPEFGKSWIHDIYRDKPRVCIDSKAMRVILALNPEEPDNRLESYPPNIVIRWISPDSNLLSLERSWRGNVGNGYFITYGDTVYVMENDERKAYHVQRKEDLYTIYNMLKVTMTLEKV